MEKKLLVIHFDDDIFELEKVSKTLSEHSLETSFEVVSVRTKEEFDSKMAKIRPDVAILDIHSEDSGEIGATLATQAKNSHIGCVVIMRSNLDDPRTIRSCLAAGADDFISKNSDKGEFCLRIVNAYELISVKRGFGLTESSSSAAQKIRTVGKSMETIKARVPRIIDSAISSIFIGGESGCGKEVVATLFKDLLPAGTPYIAVNCGAISATLLESELFGHVKGAFTGASSDRRGLIESASGGWVFLDEVATLSPSAQVALLRVLENGELIKVGSSAPKKVEVKVLSATNENIEAMIQEGLFRKDLWQRLNETRIDLLPLSKRREEVPLFIKLFAKTMKGGPYEITKSASDILCEYDWREGNVRELRNCMRAMTEFHSDRMLTPVSIPERIFDFLDAQDSSANIDRKPVGSNSEMKHEPSQTTNQSQRSSSSSQITMQIDFENPPPFDELADFLLAEVIIGIGQSSGKTSLRKLSALTKISRSTLSTRIKNIIKRGVVDGDRLQKLITITES